MRALIVNNDLAVIGGGRNKTLCRLAVRSGIDWGNHFEVKEIKGALVSLGGLGALFAGA